MTPKLQNNDEKFRVNQSSKKNQSMKGHDNIYAPSSLSAGIAEVAELEATRTPLQSDILCGKDKRAVCHEGSVRFRQTIDLYRERYCDDSTSKHERMNITKEIVAKVSESSRFLKYDSKQKIWRTISALAARDKISHALRFAHFKENKKAGKVKPCRRRAPGSSATSSSSHKEQSPEDSKLWQALISRQAKLLESIKKGRNVVTIPTFVDLPNPANLSTTVSEGSTTDFDPLSIHDNSFEETPAFRDYCLQLHRSEGTDTGSHYSQPWSCRTNLSETFEAEHHGAYGYNDDACDVTEDGANSGRSAFEDNSEANDNDSPDALSQTCGEDDIASLITEPVMQWDIEHDSIFEV